MPIHYYSSRKTASTPFRALLDQSGRLWLRTLPTFFIGAAIYRALEDSWPGGFLALFGAIFLTSLYHGWVLWRLGCRADPSFRLSGYGYLKRSLVYFLATLLLEAGVLLVSVPALLLGLIVAALLGLIGLPGSFALIVGLGIALVPAVIVSVGGVLFGCCAILGGGGPWASIVTSFRLARIDWKLTGALVTVPYLLLFLVDWVPWTSAIFEAVRGQWHQVPSFSPGGLSLGTMNRWSANWTVWLDRVARLGRLPLWYRIGLGPALEGIAVLYTLTTLWVLYSYFMENQILATSAPAAADPSARFGPKP